MHNPKGICFVNFACVNWMDTLVRQQYFEIFVDKAGICNYELKLLPAGGIKMSV